MALSFALAQYAPPAVSLLTLNVGLGHGRHFSGAIGSEIPGAGTVFYAGTALRVPPREGADPSTRYARSG